MGLGSLVMSSDDRALHGRVELCGAEQVCVEMSEAALGCAGLGNVGWAVQACLTMAAQD